MNIQEKLLWSLQRLSAILIFFLSIWLVVSLNSFLFESYIDTKEWVNKGFNSFLLFILTSSIAFHSSLGLSVIIDDYVHSSKLNKVLHILKNLFALFCILFAGFCLYFI